MARPEAEFDSAVTAISQAWIGSMQAWGNVLARAWGAGQEGAHAETDVIGDNQSEVTVTGPAGPITITALQEPGGPSTIGPEHLQLSRAGIEAGVPTTIVVTAFPTAAHSVGMHLGAIVDCNGTPIARVRVPLTPPS